METPIVVAESKIIVYRLLQKFYLNTDHLKLLPVLFPFYFSIKIDEGLLRVGKTNFIGVWKDEIRTKSGEIIVQAKLLLQKSLTIQKTLDDVEDIWFLWLWMIQTKPTTCWFWHILSHIDILPFGEGI